MATRSSIKALRQVRRAIDEWTKIQMADIRTCPDDEAFALARMLAITAIANKHIGVCADAMVHLANAALKAGGKPDPSVRIFAEVAHNVVERAERVDK